MSALYLLVLSQARDIRCLRDLRPSHLPLLRKIRHESERAAVEKYGIDKNELRFFIHYHPTYCKLSRCVFVTSQANDAARKPPQTTFTCTL